MGKTTKSQSDLPTYYLYQDAGAKWYKSDAALTREINRHVFLGRDFDQHGRAFFPQWPEPEFKSQTRSAWLLAADGERKVRWTWIITEHKKSHGKCTRLDKGQCAVQAPLLLGWDPQRKLWTKVDNPAAATKEQVRKIESNT